MKRLVSKLIFIIILALGISSFAVIKTSNKTSESEVIGNPTPNKEFEEGFADRIR